MEYLTCINSKNRLNDLNKATSEDILNVITQDGVQNNLIPELKETFPAIALSNINGSLNVITAFQSINNAKFDLDLTLSSIYNFDFAEIANAYTPDSNTLKFDVINSELNNTPFGTNTIYKAKEQFLDMFFQINRHASFLLSINSKDELLNHLNNVRVNKSINAKTCTLRFIEDNNLTHLRAVVSSNGYKRYDNALVLYIGFISINSLSVPMSITSFEISDSTLHIELLEDEKHEIDANTFVQMSVIIKNSELADGAATFTAAYHISNKQNAKFTVLEDDIAKINHRYGLQIIKNNLSGLKKIKEKRTDILSAVNKIAWSKEITPNDIMTFTSLITHLGTNIPKSVKNELHNTINSLDAINKTYKLIEIFDKFNEVIEKEDIQTKLALESKFAQWIKPFTKK